MNILKSVKEILKRRAALEKEISSIDKMLAPFGVKPGKLTDGRRRKRGPMSAEARARIMFAAPMLPSRSSAWAHSRRAVGA